MNFEKQTVLAKLLARENVTVQHGSFRTAFFDVERRVLGLPMWKDKGKDVYDLLVGHEVGHALFTPSEGWHDSQINVDGIPRSYLNVVEDIRIERMIQAKYPGLVASFKRGYSALDKDDFFGIQGVDVNTLGLMDRINLKAKLRDLIEVSFKTDEQPYVDASFAANTWEEVVEAARALYNFIKDKADDEKASQNQPQDLDDQSEAEDFDDLGGDSGGDPSDETSEDQGASEQSGNGDSDEESGTDQKNSQPSSNSNDDLDPTGEDVAVRDTDQERSDEQKDPTRVMTDESFRSREEELVDTDSRGYLPTVLLPISRRLLDRMVTTVDDLIVARDEQRRKIDQEMPWVGEAFNLDADADNEYAKFNADAKKFVNLMAKEFEMRKAAYQTQRAQSSRSGSLNVDKLYNYKFTDDIFKRVTQLADAKSHGMIMLIDYSGSMGGVIKDVIRQTLILASFCKKVNIPFDVYSFTSGCNGKPDLVLRPGEVDPNSVIVNQLLSSASNKATFNRAYRDLFIQTLDDYGVYGRAPFEGMGGTPLNEVLMGIELLADDFKAKYNLQKTTIVALTDGAANNMYFQRGDEITSNRDFRIGMKGAVVKCESRYNITRDILKHIRKKHIMIGYFLTERSYDFRGAVWDAANEFVDDSQMREYRKKYNKDKFIAFDDTKNGYDKFFVIKSERGSLNTDEDEFEVSDNAKKGEITRAFKKFAGSKKTNRVFATQFAQAIA